MSRKNKSLWMLLCYITTGTHLLHDTPCCTWQVLTLTLEQITFSQISPFTSLCPYPSKLSSISLFSRVSVKWWEGCESYLAPSGKTRQSFWIGACLTLWEWAMNELGKWKPLSIKRKALETVGCKKGASWWNLILAYPINWQNWIPTQQTLKNGIRYTS